MITNVPVVEPEATIGAVEHLLVQHSAQFASIHYIYIVKHKKLVGVLSIKELFLQAKEAIVADVMEQKIITARVHSPQERVAYLAITHNLKAIPIVSKENHFEGVVAADTIFKILDNKAVQDILRFGGVMYSGSYDNVFALPFLTSLKHRLPWLILGLFGGVLTAGIVKNFEDTLSQNLILAAFIPLVVYMADAVGTQMEAFIIRDLALDPKLNFGRYFFRQFIIVAGIGVISSVLLYAVSRIIHDNGIVSLVLSLALFCAILSSLITGLSIPFLFGKLRLDPANASGPVATIIQDIVSILVYFGIARWLL